MHQPKQNTHFQSRFLAIQLVLVVLPSKRTIANFACVSFGIFISLLIQFIGSESFALLLKKFDIF